MWGAKRRLLIFILVCGLVVLAVAVPIMIRNAAKEPVCTDDRQNGGETGIDCGGPCVRVCKEQTLPLIVEWSRIVPVAPNVFSLAFSVQNRNYAAIADETQYQCISYDSSYSKLETYKGVASFSPAGHTVMALTGLQYADVPPHSVSCSVSKNHTWLRLPAQALPFPFLYQSLRMDYSSRPNVSAMVISSDTFRTFRDITFVASVYDAHDTLVGVTTTLVEKIIPNQYYPIVFTWPQPFSGTAPYRAEITPLFEFPEYQTRQ